MIFFDSYNGTIDVKHNNASKSQDINEKLDGIVCSMINDDNKSNELFKKKECTIREDSKKEWQCYANKSDEHDKFKVKPKLMVSHDIEVQVAPSMLGLVSKH